MFGARGGRVRGFDYRFPTGPKADRALIHDPSLPLLAVRLPEKRHRRRLRLTDGLPGSICNPPTYHQRQYSTVQ